MGMNMTHSKRHNRNCHTLAELVEAISQAAHDDRLGAWIVADLINSRLIRLEGRYYGRRVLVG